MTRLNTNFLQSDSIISLDKNWQSNCIACSSTNDYGLKLKFKFLKSPKFTFSIHKVAKQFSGLDGFVHGGIIATLLDEVAGWTIVTNLRTAGLTMESNIKYNKPVPVETELIILGQLIDKTEDKKASAKIKSGIYLMDGTKLAEMTSYWYLPSINQLVKISGKSMEELLKFREDLEQTISKFIT